MPYSHPKPSRRTRRLAHLAADTVGAAAIFAAGYGLLVIGHGFGLN